jgi:hypothetical protein
VVIHQEDGPCRVTSHHLLSVGTPVDTYALRHEGGHPAVQGVERLPLRQAIRNGGVSQNHISDHQSRHIP